GGDHVAMLLAADAWHGEQNILAMDIGTNTEISLLVNGKIFSCSCASGPAFEGAHIQAGMRAAAGAIERVQIHDEQVIWQTIDGKPPIGICGSGILEAVAALKIAGAIDERGIFKKDSPLLKNRNGKNHFVLVPSTQSGTGEDIVITRNDINQIQLAKAAIQAGVKILLLEAGISAYEIDKFIIAGAFGTYLDVKSSIEIGMFPDLQIEKFSQVGNAAGVGACQMLLSKKKRNEGEVIAKAAHYIELTIHPEFSRIYLDAMYLRRGYPDSDLT
ncbi:MAG TPA: ATP-binding protein, partial [Leptolinea sp.]